MGQWGLESDAGDSVHDYLQQIQESVDNFTQKDVDPVIKAVWADGTSLDKLGVVMHLLTHELIVPIDKLEEALEFANIELHPDILATWSDGRKEMVITEINDIRYAIENKGKGRARKTNGLFENIHKNSSRYVVVDNDNVTVKLPCYGITVVLIEPKSIGPNQLQLRWGGGSITSDLKETCPYCNDPACDMGCMEFGEHCFDRDMDEQIRKQEERYEFLAHRAAVDALESIILGHGVAGINISSPAYIEGIETAVQALTNTDYSVE